MKNVELKALEYFLRILVYDLGYLIPVSQNCTTSPVTLELEKLNPQIAFTLELDLIRCKIWSWGLKIIPYVSLYSIPQNTQNTLKQV